MKAHAAPQREMEQVIQSIVDGRYCVVLGPPFSGKTRVLESVAHELSERTDCVAIVVDLRPLAVKQPSSFFHSLAARIGGLLPLTMRPPESVGVDSAFGLRTFLQDYCTVDSVLLLDHLEILSPIVLRELLSTLRAAYMERSDESSGAASRLLVVAAAALNLASVTAGESSPFRGIATTVIMKEPSTSDSVAIIRRELSLGGGRASRGAINEILRAAAGDTYLLQLVCRACVERALPRVGNVRISEARDVIAHYNHMDPMEHPPLREAIRLLEADPDLLSCVALLLRGGEVPRRLLPLPLSPDLDSLYLTGLVSVSSDNSYRLRNAIYRSVLETCFNASRLGRLLSMAGRWVTAVPQLAQAASQGDQQDRTDLLLASMSAIYASHSLDRAIATLMEVLPAGFGLSEGALWLLSADRQSLNFAGDLRAGINPALVSPSSLLLTLDCLETRAYRGGCVLTDRAGDSESIAVPLVSPGQSPVGVLSLRRGFDGSIEEGLGSDPGLMPYLSQVARAFREVSARLEQIDRETRVKELMDVVARMVQSVDDLEQTWKRILDGARDLTLAEAGAIGLISFDERLIDLKWGFPAGYSQTPVEIGANDSIMGWVAQNRAPALVSNVHDEKPWSDLYRRGLLPNTMSEITVPILNGRTGKIRGIINLESSAEAAFTKGDLELLTNLAVLAALAVHNAEQYRVVEEMEHVAAWQNWSYLVAHTLGTPLSRLRDRLALLEQQISGGRECSGSLEQMNKDMREANRLLCEFGAAPPEAVGIHKQTINLAQLIRESCANSVMSDISVMWRVSECCPPVEVDPKKISRCFRELITNASRWMRRHPREITIDLGPSPEAPSELENSREYILIVIADNGPGVPLDSKQKIFERRYTTHPDGTGWGLAVVKYYVERHGGFIRENGVPGTGARFEIYLPIAI